MKPTTELPADPALPGIEAIRALGLARVIPQLELEAGAGEIRLVGYTPGARATLEAHLGPRHLAIKLYAHDAAPEAELYEALARAGLAGDAGPRVPPFYARPGRWHGDGPCVIDLQLYGQGPSELDACMFLATIWRLGLDHPALVAEAARAEQAFLAGTEGLLDERAVAWHRAAALLRLASKVHVVERRKPHWLTRAQALLGEALQLAERAGQPAPEPRAETPAAAFKPHGAAVPLR